MTQSGGCYHVYLPPVPHDCWVPQVRDYKDYSGHIVIRSPYQPGAVIACSGCKAQWILYDITKPFVSTHLRHQPPIWRPSGSQNLCWAKSFKPPLRRP